MNQNTNPDPAKSQPQVETYVRVQNATLTYIPVFALFNMIGFLTLYYLATIDLITEARNEFLGIAAGSFTLALVYLIAQWITRRRSQTHFDMLASIAMPLFFCVNTLFMDGIFLLFLLSAWLVAGAQWLTKAPLRRSIYSSAIAAAASIIIYIIDYNPPIERIQFGTIASYASMILFGAIVTMVVALVTFMEMIRFRTISSRLVLTFAFITIIPAATTSVIVALVNFEHDRALQYRTLETIAILQENQIHAFVNSAETAAVNTAFDPAIYMRIIALTQFEANTSAYQINYDLINGFLSQARAKNTDIEEILLLDTNGICIYSTDPNNRSVNFSKHAFLRQGFVAFTGIATLDQDSVPAVLIITIPITNADGSIAALLVERQNLSAIRRVMEQVPGLEATSETYLVKSDFRPLTATRAPVDRVQTEAAINAITTGITSGNGTYRNYDNETVLGHYRWVPRIESALIAEIKQSAVLESILGILLSNAIIGGLGIIVALIAVIITAQKITAPIASLNDASRSFASGDLQARAQIESSDEIGTLSAGFNSMANRLQESILDLEDKIQIRTRDIERQAARLRAAAEVARDATLATTLDDLLNRSSQLILDRFGFYHAGIFLLDAFNEYAVLRASPTPAGQQMIANHHQLKVGETGLVGYAASTGHPRIALDTGLDAVHFQNPLLPNTRSEMALPLKIGENVIGVLNVQSEQPEAFNQDDIDTLQIMADQLAIAIERTRLLQTTEQNIAELEKATQQFTEKTWTSFSRGLSSTGYKYEGIHIQPIKDISADIRAALERGESVVIANSAKTRNASLAVPIKLRGQTIGALNLRFNQSQIPKETISLVEETATRLALALETGRLLIETQKRADREKAISAASARIGESINVDAVLRSATEELGRLISDSEITIQLKNH
jgi:GAF domain-containing protein/HAMP domain-containing protein